MANWNVILAEARVERYEPDSDNSTLIPGELYRIDEVRGGWFRMVRIGALANKVAIDEAIEWKPTT